MSITYMTKEAWRAQISDALGRAVQSPMAQNALRNPHVGQAVGRAVQNPGLVSGVGGGLLGGIAGAASGDDFSVARTLGGAAAGAGAGYGGMRALRSIGARTSPMYESMRQAGRKQLPAASGGSSPQTMHPFRATATGAPVSVSPAQQAGRQEAGRLLLPRRAGPSHFPAHAPRKPTVRQKAENVLFQRDSQRHFGVEGRGSAHRYTAGEKGIAADTMGIQGKTQSLWRDLQKNPDATMNKLVTRIQSGKGSAADQAIYDHVRRAGGLKKVLGRTAPPSATPPRPTPPTPATSPEALQYEQAMQQGLL